MTTHSSILAWETPWTEETRGPQSMALQESDMTWRLNSNNISGIIFLTSNSTCSFLIYSKAVDFCILTYFLQPLYHYLLVPGVYCC